MISVERNAFTKGSLKIWNCFHSFISLPFTLTQAYIRNKPHKKTNHSCRNANLWTGAHTAGCMCCVCPAVWGCCQGYGWLSVRGKVKPAVLGHFDTQTTVSLNLSKWRTSCQSVLSFDQTHNSHHFGESVLDKRSSLLPLKVSLRLRICLSDHESPQD